MYKALPLLLSSFLLFGCATVPITDQSVEDPSTDTPLEESQNSEDDSFKGALEAGTFENDVVKFALYYEYELGVTKLSENKVEIFEKGNPKAIASVEWYTNSESDYFNHLNGITQGGNWASYEFPESNNDLRSKLEVKQVSGKELGETYAVTWQENIGENFVIIETFEKDQKSLSVATGIIETIELL